MALRRVPKSTRLARVLRRHRLDRNPLRRGYDRAETAVLGVLLAAFLAGAPFAAQATASMTHAAAAREQQAQRAVLRQVPAILLRAESMSSRYPATVAIFRDVTARWRAPDGQVHTGSLYVPDGAAAGSTIMVWINRAGLLAGPPLQASQIATRANLAALCAVAVLAVMLTATGWLTRRMLDRRRLAAWDAAWQATGPGWTSRR